MISVRARTLAITLNLKRARAQALSQAEGGTVHVIADPDYPDAPSPYAIADDAALENFYHFTAGDYLTRILYTYVDGQLET